jgi:hypothetical protein
MAVALVVTLFAAPAVGGDESGEPVNRVVLRDARGDVWGIGEGENETYTLARRKPTVDITRTIAAHGRRAITVRLWFKNLRRAGGESFVAQYNTRASYGMAFVSVGPRAWRGEHTLVDDEYARVRCPKFTHHVDYANDSVVMRIPRRCVDEPAWVSLDIASYLFTGGERTFREFTDNPHNAGHRSGTTRRLYHGGRLRV